MSHEYSMVYRSLSVNLPVSKLPDYLSVGHRSWPPHKGARGMKKSYKRTINQPSIIKLSIQRQSFTIHRINLKP